MINWNNNYIKKGCKIKYWNKRCSSYNSEIKVLNNSWLKHIEAYRYLKVRVGR